MKNQVPKQPAKKNTWFGKINTKDEALKVIKDASKGFYVLAGIQVGLGLLIGIAAVIDGIIYAVLAFLLRKFNSRTVAVTLLVLSCTAIVATVMNRLGYEIGGGRNIFLAIIMIWVSIRAIQATFKFHKFQ